MALSNEINKVLNKYTYRNGQYSLALIDLLFHLPSYYEENEIKEKLEKLENKKLLLEQLENEKEKPLELRQKISKLKEEIPLLEKELFKIPTLKGNSNLRSCVDKIKAFLKHPNEFAEDNLRAHICVEFSGMVPEEDRNGIIEKIKNSDEFNKYLELHPGRNEKMYFYITYSLNEDGASLRLEYVTQLVEGLQNWLDKNKDNVRPSNYTIVFIPKKHKSNVELDEEEVVKEVEYVKEENIDEEEVVNEEEKDVKKEDLIHFMYAKTFVEYVEKQMLNDKFYRENYSISKVCKKRKCLYYEWFFVPRDFIEENSYWKTPVPTDSKKAYRRLKKDTYIPLQKPSGEWIPTKSNYFDPDKSDKGKLRWSRGRFDIYANGDKQFVLTAYDKNGHILTNARNVGGKVKRNNKLVKSLKHFYDTLSTLGVCEEKSYRTFVSNDNWKKYVNKGIELNDCIIYFQCSEDIDISQDFTSTKLDKVDGNWVLHFIEELVDIIKCAGKAIYYIAKKCFFVKFIDLNTIVAKGVSQYKLE